MKTITTSVRTVLAAATLVGVLGVPAAQASPAPAHGTYRYNVCLDADRTASYPEGDSCFWVQNRRPQSSFQLTAGAFDGKKDGLSVETTVLVYQQVDGVWRKSRELRAIASGGTYTSRVGDTVSINKMARATQVGFIIRSCLLDRPTGIRHGCADAKATTASWDLR